MSSLLGGFAAKAALKKYGISKDLFDFSPAELAGQPPRQPNKLRKAPPSPRPEDDVADADGSWTSWMSIKALPLTVQPWLAPPPPPVDVAARVPGIGDKAPRDPAGRLVFGGGKRILVAFLRCAGCAFAQKTFMDLRTLANRYSGSIHCIAVSHSSEQATRKWVDMMGGSWAVQVIVDEDRASYAAWGLGLGGMWYLFNPTTQVQGWKEKGWLGDKVAGAIQKGGGAEVKEVKPKSEGFDDDEDEDDGPLTTMGNKWQEAGSFAVDGTGTVIWGNKALRADDVMNLEEGARLLMA